MVNVNQTVFTNQTTQETNKTAQKPIEAKSQDSLFSAHNAYASDMFNPELAETLFSFLETSIANARANLALTPSFDMFGANPWMGSMTNPFMTGMMPDFEVPTEQATYQNVKNSKISTEDKREQAQAEKIKMDAKPKEAVADKTETTIKQRVTNASTQRIDSFDNVIERIAKEEGVDPKLLKAMIHQESGGKHNAVSYKGAGGLMQLMPGTAKAMGVKDRFDPEQNIRGGAKYLAQQLKRHNGDVKLALASYNAGPGAVQKHGGIPPYKETQNYVASIMAKYQG